MAKGTRLPAERRTFSDGFTATRIMQVTAADAVHHHLYFLTSSWTEDESLLFLVSYRTGHPNLYGVQWETGEMVQLTETDCLNPFSAVVAFGGRALLFTAGSDVRRLELPGLEESVLARFPGATLGEVAISPDERWLATTVKLGGSCRIIRMRLDGSETGTVVEDPEAGHLSFHPRDPERIVYSGSVDRRIWVTRLDGSGTRWLAETQRPGEWLTHESWLPDGSIMFVHWPFALKRAESDSGLVTTLFPGNVWHPSANRNGTQVVFDTARPDRGIFVHALPNGPTRLLCRPGASCKGWMWDRTYPDGGTGIDRTMLRAESGLTAVPGPDEPASMYGPQWTHPHPSFSPSGKRVVYTSDCLGYSQVFVAEL